MKRFKCILLTTALALALAGTASATTLPASSAGTQPAFADLDTDADGYLSQTDIPAGHQLSLQFAVADTDADVRLSQSEFEAYESASEKEEAEQEEE